MSNQQERLARQWAEGVSPSIKNEYVVAAKEFILATTTPSTMEGVEWVHAEHHMAGAYWEGDIPVVMIDPSDEAKTTVLTVEEECIHEADDSDLVPNGKRYKLVEASVSSNENGADDQQDHPEYLETEEDFQNAPIGTIVGDYLRRAEGKTEVLWQKLEDGRWWHVGANYYARLHGCTRPVLRWGDEA